jgi:hypothetical protein
MGALGRRNTRNVAVLVNDSGPVNGQAKYCKKGEGRVEEGIESTAVSFEILTSV